MLPAEHPAIFPSIIKEGLSSHAHSKVRSLCSNEVLPIQVLGSIEARDVAIRLAIGMVFHDPVLQRAVGRMRLQRFAKRPPIISACKVGHE